MNKHLREDMSPGDGSSPSLYPTVQTDSSRRHLSVLEDYGVALWTVILVQRWVWPDMPIWE